MLTVHNNNLNLGEVKYGSSTNNHFTITNNYSNVLKITNVAPGCGSCTTVGSYNNTLNPGESISIPFTFTPNSLGVGIEKKLTLYFSVSNTDNEHVLKFSSNVTQ